MEAPDFTPDDWREWRRLRALQLKQQGWYQRDIAAALGITEVTVSRWRAQVRLGGPGALRTRSSPGRPPKLSPAQKRLIPEFLWHGTEAYGFRGEVWTCKRVAKVIKEEFGVSYGKGHVSRLLKELQWTPQVPIRRAIQRDEQPIGGGAVDIQFVASEAGNVGREALPVYAHDLNPWDEGGWHYLKDVEMDNLVCRDLEELEEECHLAVARQRQKPHLVQSFFAQAGLKLQKV